MSRPRKPSARAKPADDAIELMTASAEATEALGEQIGKRAWPGMVLALHGELGAGKTTFMRGFLAGAGGGADAVKSPTFVLVREYPARIPVVHADGYRLSGGNEAAWLDVDLIFSPDKATAVEWPERFGDLLPEKRVEIYFSHVSTHRRCIRLQGTADAERACVKEAAAAIQTQPTETVE